MSERIETARIAFLATDGVEQVELDQPWDAVLVAGGEAELVSLESGEIQAFHHLDKGDTHPVDHTVDEADPAGYTALVLPGGVANGDFVRADERAARFVRAFVDADKPIAVICHGGWVLIEANAVQGRTLTSWPSLRTDLRNAGATWVDQDVVVDGNLISSRRPSDLPKFCQTLIGLVGATLRGRHAAV